ncbi:MAG: uracil-DNA glycosylase [Rhodocyclales bacterium]|nr:uracil-DNA glycosylase [Rhodocyclales bacterium]
MGLTPLWRLRTRLQPGSGAGEEQEAQKKASAGVAPPGRAPEAPRKKPAAAAAVPAPAKERSEARPPRASSEPVGRSPALHPVSAASGTPAASPSARTIDPERAARIATLDWEALEAEIRACSACTLHRTRTQAVTGVGNRQARWMFVGEGPGREEDRRGEPFVGPAGKLLDAMLFALRLDRTQVYIANAVKCRPPDNRTPTPEEIAACAPFLFRQIELVRPKVLVALGRPAAFALLNEEIKIAQARGRIFRYGEIPVVVTYHPAYLLRNPADKAKAWEDLCRAQALVEGKD